MDRIAAGERFEAPAERPSADGIAQQAGVAGPYDPRVGEGWSLRGSQDGQG